MGCGRVWCGSRQAGAGAAGGWPGREMSERRWALVGCRVLRRLNARKRCDQQWSRVDRWSSTRRSWCECRQQHPEGREQDEENSNAGLRRPGGMLLVMNEGETCCLVRRSWCVRGIPAHCRRAGFSTPTTNLVSLAAKGTKSLPLHACAMQAYCPRTQSSQPSCGGNTLGALRRQVGAMSIVEGVIVMGKV